MTDKVRAIAASGTVASHAPHRAAARLGHSVTVNYRKEVKMADDYDLYDELRSCAYRASEAGWSKTRILNELNAVVELVRDDDDEFPGEESA